MEVKYPNNSDKEKSIQSIINEASVKRENPFAFLINSYKEIGFGVIFKNSLSVYIASVIAYIGFLAWSLTECFTIITNTDNFINMYHMFFGVSPLIMGMSNILFLLVEPPSEFEFKNACKYCSRRIELIKMPFVAVIQIVINSVAAIAWCIVSEYNDIFSLLGVSAFGVLLYGVINVAIYNRFKKNYGIFCIIFWVLLNSLLLALDRGTRLVLFVGVPAIAHIAVVGGLLLVFVKTIQKSYYRRGIQNA